MGEEKQKNTRLEDLLSRTRDNNVDLNHLAQKLNILEFKLTRRYSDFDVKGDEPSEETVFKEGLIGELEDEADTTRSNIEYIAIILNKLEDLI